MSDLLEVDGSITVGKMHVGGVFGHGKIMLWDVEIEKVLLLNQEVGKG